MWRTFSIPLIAFTSIQLSFFFTETSLCESDDGVCKMMMNDSSTFIFSIRRGYVFKLFFFLFPFPSTLFGALLRFHSFLLQPFQDSAVAKKFISFSKSLSTRNQFRRDGFKFHISDIEETSGLGFLLSSSFLNVPFGNRISSFASFVDSHTRLTHNFTSLLLHLLQARMYCDFSVFRYRRLSFDFFPIFFSLSVAVCFNLIRFDSFRDATLTIEAL